MSEQRFFLIPTIGHNAAAWAAMAFDTHPEIKCSMGFLAGHLMPHGEYDNIRRGRDEREQKLADIYSKKIQILRENASLDDLFDALSHDSPKRVFGDIHGMCVGGLLDNFGKYGPTKRKVAYATIIRHPITWIDSYIRRLLWLHESGKGDPNLDSMKKKTQRFCALNKGIETHIGFDPEDPKAQATIYTLQTFMNRMIVDVRHAASSNGWRTFQMEKLLEDRDYLYEAVHHLSHGTIEADQDYLEKVISSEMENFGLLTTGNRDKRTPSDVFAQLERHQKILMVETFKRKGVFELFAAQGYEFSLAE